MDGISSLDNMVALILVQGVAEQEGTYSPMSAFHAHSQASLSPIPLKVLHTGIEEIHETFFR